jgi:electron transport complex protein RnfG
MYRAMVGVGLACGLLIVTVFQATLPVIQRNRAEALQRAIFQVLPEARSSATFRLTDDERFDVVEGAAAGGSLVYAGYDDQQRLVGLAIEARGMGYQDVIRVLYVLESKETPGLGDKIETDADFLRNFEALDVTLTDDLSALAHSIEATRSGEKEHPWQVDGITGATISSVAIADMLDRSAARWLPLLLRNLDDFRTEG